MNPLPWGLALSPSGMECVHTVHCEQCTLGLVKKTHITHLNNIFRRNCEPNWEPTALDNSISSRNPTYSLATFHSEKGNTPALPVAKSLQDVSKMSAAQIRFDGVAHCQQPWWSGHEKMRVATGKLNAWTEAGSK